MKHTIVFVVESIHTPTDNELRALNEAILYTGLQQGFEPLSSSANCEGAHSYIADRAQYDKWKSQL